MAQQQCVSGGGGGIGREGCSEDSHAKKKGRLREAVLSRVTLPLRGSRKRRLGDVWVAALQEGAAETRPKRAPLFRGEDSRCVTVPRRKCRAERERKAVHFLRVMQAASVACPGVLVSGEEEESGAVLPHHWRMRGVWHPRVLAPLFPCHAARRRNAGNAQGSRQRERGKLSSAIVERAPGTSFCCGPQLRRRRGPPGQLHSQVNDPVVEKNHRHDTIEEPCVGRQPSEMGDVPLRP